MIPLQESWRCDALYCLTFKYSFERYFWYNRYGKDKVEELQHLNLPAQSTILSKNANSCRVLIWLPNGFLVPTTSSYTLNETIRIRILYRHVLPKKINPNLFIHTNPMIMIPLQESWQCAIFALGGLPKKTFFFGISFPNVGGWGGWFPNKVQTPQKKNKSTRKSPFSTRITPFVFPNLIKTLGWVDG